MRSLDIGATGMMAQQLNVDVISNNIANMSTTGFKQSRAVFHDLLYQNFNRPGSSSSDSGTTLPSGLQVGLGTKAAGVYRIHTQGTVLVTNNNLDLAIKGDGFFQIDMPDGTTTYTRDGSFQMNENGEIVTIDGYIVSPSITIPEDAVSIDINSQGEVIAAYRGQAATQVIGQFQLAAFVNPAGLESIGNNLYLETSASGSPSTSTPGVNQFGAIEQGALEESNVNVVSAITDLISSQRAYEMNSNVISTSDEMLQALTQLR
ncbi:MAG: flagellar basal-body rod protein FlgG [Alphaproteobacteria bacterium]|nr:flagellar basal-body rod protein FlgG [Alphaproteobacteria bacterium]